jgi:SAM-dependent MidA family methyltransferase
LKIADVLKIADLLEGVIRERGPLTVAAFMDLALYDPEFGYYARAAQRSGRAGDFFTSVDVGEVFGELLEIQIAEMAEILAGGSRRATYDFDLVEAGAGNGRLSADILRTARLHHPDLYDRTRLHLVETSAAARAAQSSALAEVADRLISSSPALPASFEGVLVANELLDALPVHQVVMREEGLREVYIDRRRGTSRIGGGLVTREGAPSTPGLSDHLARLHVSLEPGWRVEISLRASAWVGDAARRLRRGFLILIDYGHEARELYSATHAAGTLTTFARHVAAGADPAAACPPWLLQPGEQDITAHVDFTTVRAAAEGEGLVTLGFLDQTYFLMGLHGLGAHFEESLKKRLALKTLLLPGGLGSTMKVLILGKGVGAPALRGCSYRMRVT